jgi:sugar/nucleoside kinase (ribokinase family)
MTLSPSSPDFVAYSGLIIDDIVLPDGRTFMNTLGGSATHALVGMRVWSERLGYFAAVGADEMPADYLAARGFHICHGTFADTLDVVTRLRDVNPTTCIVWEPTPLQLSPTVDEMRALLASVDAFSPDRGEAMATTGQDTIDGAVRTLLDWGAPVIALRMGAEGSRVDTAGGDPFRIPAVPVNVVDTTGGGDAYCGGLLVALANGETAAEAGARAAVSASFAIEQFGVPAFGEHTRDEAEKRLAWAREHIVIGSAVP